MFRNILKILDRSFICHIVQYINIDSRRKHKRILIGRQHHRCSIIMMMFVIQIPLH
ncbi:hypothetical protein BLA29_013141 [Euroglyphus maynei]|uniref:Uncharacterized protein n=1 Tax=Euroglyphus maynei TaxID=6958 RepID=A0A1Y3B8T0_EURMA|nr:hypothetical protein BLA29_013141 [Euroglyphus maynei]